MQKTIVSFHLVGIFILKGQKLPISTKNGQISEILKVSIFTKMDTVAIIIVPGASNLDFYNLKHLRKQLTYENQDILPIKLAKRGPVIRKS